MPYGRGMTVLETQRLLLRPYREDDAQRVLEIRSDMDVIRWLSDPPFVPMPDLDAARAWIADANDSKDPRTRVFAVEVRETGLMVGSVLIAPMPTSDPPVFEIGWHLHRDSHGHGYATEAGRVLLDDSFARYDGRDAEHPLLEELWCGMYPDNVPSASVARKLGLEDLGVRDDPWYEGDSQFFLATRAGWERGAYR